VNMMVCVVDCMHFGVFLYFGRILGKSLELDDLVDCRCLTSKGGGG